MYGKEENSNQFTVPEELHRGQGLPGNERTGAVGDLPKDIKRSLSGLSEFINKNPDGFTVNKFVNQYQALYLANNYYW